MESDQLYRSWSPLDQSVNSPPGIIPLQRHFPSGRHPDRDHGVLLFGDTVMKVALISWTVALMIALLVAGRSLEQILLSSKIALIGFVLGFIGAKVSDSLHAYRKTRTVKIRR